MLRPHPTHSLLVNALIACFGNGRPEVRAHAQSALVDLVRIVGADDAFAALMAAARTATNAHVRESVLRFFALAVDALGAGAVVAFGVFLPCAIEVPRP